MCNIQEMRFNEKINSKRANIIATLPEDEFISIFGNNKVKDNEGNDMDTQQYIKNIRRWVKKMILCNCEENKKYKYSSKLNTDGRLYSSNFGVQNLNSKIRGYLCSEYYNDVDIKNASPTILYYILKKSFPDEKFTFLKTYINNRDEVLQKLNNDRNKAKESILVMMNSSKYQTSKNKFLIQLDKDFKKAQKLIFNCSNEFTKPAECFKGGLGKRNPLGQYLSIVVFIMEKKILLEGISCFEKKYISTLIFDGFHLDKSINKQEALSKLNNKTSEYGIKWDVKPFSEELNYLDNKEFEGNENEFKTYELVKKEFEKNHFVIESPLQFGKEMIYKDEATYTIYNKNDFATLVSSFKFEDIKTAKNGEVYNIEKLFFPSWLEDQNKRSYKKLDFIPKKIIDDGETYNTFRGFMCDKFYEYEEKPEIIEIFKKQIDILTDNHKESSDYLISYIADIFQNPDKNPKVAILFKSKQGFGKDTLIDLIECMLGMEYVARTEKIEDFLGTYNEAIKNKIILQINELEGKDGWEYKDKIKGLSTCDKTLINPKHNKPYKQSFFSRIFIMSNRMNPIEIANDDRRFVVFKAQAKKPPRSHFNELHSIRNDKDKLYTLFNYLKNYKINIKSWDDDRPMTKAYTNMKETNINPIYLFIKEIISDGRIDDYLEKEDGTYYKNKKNGNYLIGCDDFLRGYRYYCSENDYEIKTNAREVKKYLNEIDIDRERKLINSKRCYFYCFDKIKVNDHLESMNLNEMEEQLSDEWE